MLIDSLLIVLRETLEAGVLISVLLAIGVSRRASPIWFAVGMACGLAGAVVYAHYLGQISIWFDYVGQELVNASLQFALYGCLLAVLAALAFQRLWRLCLVLMAVSVSLALVREGTEIIVFFSGYNAADHSLLNVLLSGFVGLMIGLSVGALSYFSLTSMPAFWARPIQVLLLVLLGAGLVVQATQLLIQADIISAAYPVWDSSTLLSEESLTGQMVYAVFGYESTPSLVEAIAYALALLTMIAVALVCHGGNVLRHKVPRQAKGGV